jgi:hypothetical protein
MKGCKELLNRSAVNLAMQAVSYGIDKLKETVPIWKKEIYEDGAAQWKENKVRQFKQLRYFSVLEQYFAWLSSQAIPGDVSFRN